MVLIAIASNHDYSIPGAVTTLVENLVVLNLVICCSQNSVRTFQRAYDQMVYCCLEFNYQGLALFEFLIS